MNEQQPRQRYPRDGRPDDEIELREIWNILMRNRGVILGCVAAVVAVTAAWTFLRVPVYESTASVRIDEEQSDVPVLDILQNISTGSQVETEMEVLRSRTLAESVVDSVGLQLVVESPRRTAREALVGDVRVDRRVEEAEYLLERREGGFAVIDGESGEELGTASPGGDVEIPGATFTLRPGAGEVEAIELAVLPFDRAVSRLREALSVSRPNREANVVTLRYESTDTVLVHRVPNTLARHFIGRRQEVQKTEARSTVDFLREQIDTLRTQLTAAEDTLQEFREAEQVIAIEAEASAQVEQLAELQARRNQLASERDALRSLVEEIEQERQELEPGESSPWRRLISFPSLLQNQATSELLRSLNELDQQRGELLQRRTFEDPDVENLTRRIRELETQLRRIATTYLQGLANQVESLDETLAQFGTDLERIPGKQVQLARLERQTSVLEEIYTLLQTRLKEAQIAQAVEDPSVRVVDPAILPEEPVRPRIPLNVALALVLGSMLGVGAAFTREYMDDTVHTREDVQLATGGAPVLGLIPRIREAEVTNGRPRRVRKGRKVSGEAEELEQRLVAGRDPRNPVSEAYRNLRTNITFSRAEEPPRTLVFTSPLPRDGKTTSTSNLAITLAQQGLDVLLIDSDMRRGILHNVFRTGRDPGLSELILEQCELEEAVRTVDLGESGSLDFIPTGTLPPNPAELLGSARMKTMLARFGETHDAVLLDSPPLNVVTDAAVLGTEVDGVIVVARASVTKRGALSYAGEQLRQVGAPILGSVLNDVDFRREGRYYGAHDQYGYNYEYYYGAEGEGE